jgi:hypothetical protein
MEEDSDTPITTPRKFKRNRKAFISESTAEEDKFDNVTKKSKADGTHAAYKSMGNRFTNFVAEKHPDQIREASGDGENDDSIDVHWSTIDVDIIKDFFESCAQFNAKKSTEGVPVYNEDNTIESYISALKHIFEANGCPLSEATLKMLRRFRKGGKRRKQSKVEAGEISGEDNARVLSNFLYSY